MEKSHRIAEYTFNIFLRGVDAGIVFHDVDLQKWSLLSTEIFGFKNTRKETFKVETENFANKMKPRITKNGRENVYKSAQSGI